MDAPELWDIRDADGVLTGTVWQRGAPGWPGGFHLVAATCGVRADGRVLVTRRSVTKDAPETLEFPGGSAVSGESSREAAARELREETGLVVDPVDLMPVSRFLEDRALFDLFVAVSVRPGSLRLDPAEVVSAAWVDVVELERLREAHQFGVAWEARLDAFWAPLMATLHGVNGY